MIKLLIADDHPLIAQGIKNTINSHDHMSVLHTCKNGKEVIDFVSQNKVDVVLLDVEMPVMNGIECAEILVKKHPTLKIIILSMYQEQTIIENLLKIGVHGYLLKTIPENTLTNAINKVCKGEKCFDDTLLKNKTLTVVNYVNSKDDLKDLSKREKEILTYLSKGLTNKEIGNELFISPRTVDTHRTNLMKKLGIHNIAGLIRFAYKTGLN